MARILCPACMGYTRLTTDGFLGPGGVMIKHKIPPEIADKVGAPRDFLCRGSLRSVWSLYQTGQVMTEKLPDGSLILPDLSRADPVTTKPGRG